MNFDDSLVSVIIPSKNRQKFVMKAIESVFAQTYKNVEIIIVDDGSDVPLGEILKNKFGSKIVILRHEQSLGAPAARNTGIKYAKGKYIAFLDDDDIWLPEKLEKQMLLFTKDVALVYCGEALFSDGQLVRKIPAKQNQNIKYNMLGRNVVGGTSVPVVVRERLLALDGFDETLPSCQDWDLWLRVVGKYKIKCVEEILVHRIIHGDQISTLLEKRISGRVQFLNKHRTLISENSFTLSQHLRRLACLYIEFNNRPLAKKYFVEAIKCCPLSRNNYICFLVFSFLPKRLSKKILTTYAVSKFNGKAIYH